MLIRIVKMRFRESEINTFLKGVNIWRYTKINMIPVSSLRIAIGRVKIISIVTDTLSCLKGFGQRRKYYLTLNQKPGV